MRASSIGADGRQWFVAQRPAVAPQCTSLRMTRVTGRRPAPSRSVTARAASPGQALGRLMPADQLAAAVLPGRLPEAGLEDPGEVSHVLEAPAPGDRLHPALGQRRVLQVAAAVVQPAFPYPAGDRRALLVEQLVQVPDGDVIGAGDG